jgi:Uncharacterized conserved protein
MVSDNPHIGTDYELSMGRKRYASDLAGAYYAARLPVLEYLNSVRRQAGAFVILEVYPDWIPLGVWRFRELCREAFKKKAMTFGTMEETLSALAGNVSLPLNRYTGRSAVLRNFSSQKKLTDFQFGF